MVNVGKYTIHGSYGIWICSQYISSCFPLSLYIVVALIHQITPLNKLTNQNLDLQHWTATGGKTHLLASLYCFPRQGLVRFWFLPFPLIPIFWGFIPIPLSSTSAQAHCPSSHALVQLPSFQASVSNPLTWRAETESDQRCHWKFQESHANHHTSPRYLWWEASFLLHWGYNSEVVSFLSSPFIDTKSNWTLHSCTKSMHQPKKSWPFALSCRQACCG